MIIDKKKRGMKKGTTNAGSFKPGNKVACEKALTPEIREIRTATKTQLFQAFKRFMECKMDEIGQYDLDQLPLLDKGILKSLIEFSNTGDYDAIKYILDQIIGRAKESIELSNPDDEKIKINVTIENVD